MAFDGDEEGPCPRREASVIFLEQMRRLKPSRLAFIALLGLFVACSHPPRREIAEARKGLADAEKVHAPVYARASFDEARKTLQEAERLIGQRKYEEARVIALESAALSRSAISMSAENEKKMLDALDLNLEATQHELADAELEIGTARAQHVETPKIELFERDLTAARAKLETARRLHAGGDFSAGQRAADDARVSADLVLREIRFAIAENPITHPTVKKRRRARAHP
jgi:predicted S18 family serine protease